MESRAWMLIAGALAILMLTGGACICGGMGLLMVDVADDDVVNEAAIREGMALGAHSTSEDCIVQTHTRTVQCTTLDGGCNEAARAFFGACLRAVPEPDAALCVGVPAPTTFRDWHFGDRICAQHGWNSDEGDCDPISAGISVYCHSQP